MDITLDIKSDISCNICYDKFIKLTSRQYYKLLNDYEHLLPSSFEDDTCCQLYEDRFECLICKDVKICRKCYWSFKNHNFKPDDDCVEEYEYFDEVDIDGFAEGCPGEDCPIICPFCRTKDYKIFYGNRLPYELLLEIRDRFGEP